jgi:hypothetical protein
MELETIVTCSQITDMCGRYASFLPPEFLARLFATVNPLPNLRPTWNLAPTDDAPVIRLDRETGARHLDVLKWGLITYFTKDLKTARHPINARSDTVAGSGMFKAAFAKRRCLVPATAYYEWRDDPEGKTPFAVARLDGEPKRVGNVKNNGPELLEQHGQRPSNRRCSNTHNLRGWHNDAGSAQDRRPVPMRRCLSRDLTMPGRDPSRHRNTA